MQLPVGIEASFIFGALREEPNVHSILDIGGGSGRFAIPLQKRGYKVTVIEVDLLPLSWLKIRSPDSKVLLSGRHADGWPVRDSSFDCILTIETPVVEFSWFWQECRRVLRPGGIIIFSDNNANSYKGAAYKIKPFLRRFLSEKGKIWADQDGYYNMSAHEIIKLMEQDNFKLDKALGFNWLPIGRNSDFFLAPFYALIERALGLRKLALISPWVLIKATARNRPVQDRQPKAAK